MVREGEVSRRGFLRGTALAGVGGLVVGGGLGAGAMAALQGGGSKTAPAKVGPVRIGLPLPTTGPLAGDAEESRRGATIAVEELNATGGFGGSISTHVVDIADLSPEKVKTGFTGLISRDKVDALITPYMYAIGPDFDVVSQAQVPYLHHTSLTDVVDAVKKNFSKYWMIFQDDPTERSHGTGLVPLLDQFAASGKWTPRNRKIYIITANNSYSTKIAHAMADAMTAKGWQVVSLDEVVTPFTEWGPILSKIRNSSPDVIFNTDYIVGDVAAFQNQFMQNPTPSLMYQQYAPSVPEYLSLTGSKANGVIWATVQGLLNDSVGKAWIKRYTARWNAAPGGAIAAAMYDSVYIYAQAVLRVGGPADRRKVADAIRSTIFRGVSGAHSFLPDDNSVPSYPTEQADAGLGMPHFYYQIRSQKHLAVSPAPYVEAQFELPPWFA